MLPSGLWCFNILQHLLLLSSCKLCTDITSSHVISFLKYQYDCVLRGQSLIVLGHPSCTICANNLSVESFAVASHISCNLSGLAGTICVIKWAGIHSMLFRLLLQSCGSSVRDPTLESASAMTFSLPHRYSLCTSYWASLRNNLCSLGLDVAIVFFHMLVSS